MLKKLLWIGAGFLLAVVVMGVTGLAYAQTQNPPDEVGSCLGMAGNCDGSGMMAGGHGRHGQGGGMMQGAGPGRMGGAGGPGRQGGWMQEYTLPLVAEALGLSVEDLQWRFEAGETAWTIAQEQGLTADAFGELMTQVHTDALAQAVADGLLTQEQADARLAHMNQMRQNGPNCPLNNP